MTIVEKSQDFPEDLTSKLIDFILKVDESKVRALLMVEFLLRSKRDFSRHFRKIFGETWEFKILEVLIKKGSMNKSQISFTLFERVGRHYKLSRSNTISRAFSHLLDEGVIVITKDLGHTKLYDINEEYKPLVKLLVG